MIDLNADVGEGMPWDEQLLAHVTSANVACGEHAASWEIAQTTARLAIARGVRVGVHPGYPDRESFGRAPMPTRREASYEQSLVRQVKRFVEAGFTPAYLKPHGAFYNESTHPGPAAQILERLLREFRLSLMGLPVGEHAHLAERARVPFLREGFVDRAYEQDGHLRSRSAPGAILGRDEAAAQAIRLAPLVDSLCVHGDGPDCVAIARRVREALLDV